MEDYSKGFLFIFASLTFCVAVSGSAGGQSTHCVLPHDWTARVDQKKIDRIINQTGLHGRSQFHDLLKDAEAQGLTVPDMTETAKANGLNLTEHEVCFLLLESKGDVQRPDAAQVGDYSNYKCDLMTPLEMWDASKKLNMTFDKVVDLMKDAAKNGHTPELIAANGKRRANVSMTANQVVCHLDPRKHQEALNSKYPAFTGAPASTGAPIVGTVAGGHATTPYVSVPYTTAASRPQLPDADHISSRLNDISQKSGIPKQKIVDTVHNLKAQGKTHSDIAQIAKNLGYDVTPAEVEGFITQYPSSAADQPIINDPCSVRFRGPFKSSLYPNGFYLNSCGKIVPLEEGKCASRLSGPHYDEHGDLFYEDACGNLIPEKLVRNPFDVEAKTPQPTPVQTAPPTTTSGCNSATPVHELLDTAAIISNVNKKTIISIIIGGYRQGKSVDEISAEAKKQGLQICPSQVQQLIDERNQSGSNPGTYDGSFKSITEQPEQNWLKFNNRR